MEEGQSHPPRWSPSDKRDKPLVPFGRDGEQTTMELLQRNLGPDAQREVPEDIRNELTASIARDVEELHAHLQPRGEADLADTISKLEARGDAEARELTRILIDQRKRVISELEKNKDWQQRELGLDDDENWILPQTTRWVSNGITTAPARLRIDRC